MRPRRLNPAAGKGRSLSQRQLRRLCQENRLGFNAETSWEYRKVSYDGYESYRPIFADVNALFEPQIRKKLSLDLMAGVGIDSNRFYLPE